MTTSKQVNPLVTQFKEIYDSPSSYDSEGKLTAAAANQISQIDFLSFSISDIKVVQDATKLPDDLAVNILKKWMIQQDRLLSDLRGYLIYTPSISKERLSDFLSVMKNPSQECNLIVNNILYQLSTGGGLRDPIPLINLSKPEESLIEYEDRPQSNSEINHTIEYLFNPNIEAENQHSQDPKFYNGSLVNNQFLIIGLPPFLKVKLTSYRIRAPPLVKNSRAKGGLRSWNIYGGNSIEEISDTLNAHEIHSVKEDSQLENPNSEATYTVDNQTEYYRYFKIKNDGRNNQGNNALLLSAFYISGCIQICKE